MSITLRAARLDEVLPLRKAVIRPEAALEALAAPGDRAADTMHVTARRDGQVIGIISVMREICPRSREEEAWRARYLGVAESARRQGVGKRLLQAAFGYAAARNGALVWGTARSGIVGLHLSLGMRTVGPEFEMPGTGPHYLVVRPVQPEDLKFLILIDGLTFPPS